MFHAFLLPLNSRLLAFLGATSRDDGFLTAIELACEQHSDIIGHQYKLLFVALDFRVMSSAVLKDKSWNVTPPNYWFCFFPYLPLQECAFFLRLTLFSYSNSTQKKLIWMLKKISSVPDHSSEIRLDKVKCFNLKIKSDTQVFGSSGGPPRMPAPPPHPKKSH